MSRQTRIFISIPLPSNPDELEKNASAKVATANRKKKKYIIITVNCSNLEPLEM
ncbi:MAG: hypothetical protein WA941_07970 [Nitrososphaeraceae archaeon]